MILFNLLITFLIGGNAFADEAVSPLKHEILKNEGVYQTRSYAAYFVAETIYNTENNETSRDAFMRLFRYISGYNQVQESIEMTVPVTDQKSVEIEMTVPVTDEQQGSAVAMHFMIPSRFSESEIPAPLDPRVEIVEIPARKMAVITFSGYDTKARRATKEKQLRNWINKQKELKILEGPIFAGYDAPEVPADERRNEVMFVIE